MGMTPLEGLVMATRSGDIDPGLFAYLTKRRGMSVDELDTLLNRESGLLGVSGLSGDMRELEAAAHGGNTRAELALTLFAYRVRKAIGAYLAVLGGADAIVFTGGAGTHSPALRRRILAGLDGLGVHLDATANRACTGGEARISDADSPVALLVVAANEELLIARDAAAASR
jgi:acetate kinase